MREGFEPPAIRPRFQYCRGPMRELLGSMREELRQVLRDARRLRPPRGAVVVVVVGLLATIAAALLSSDKHALVDSVLENLISRHRAVPKLLVREELRAKV